MQLLHSPARTRAVFDDPNLLAHAGLAPLLALAGRTGLPDLLAGAAPAGPCGANAATKAMCLIAGMAAGADSIQDMDLLRDGAMETVSGEIRAPSTPGSFLRAFTRDPHVALAYHTREHGFSASHRYVLAQGQASVGMTPSRERLEELISQGERHVGEVKRGPVWDRFLREYYYERVIVDIAVERVLTWPDLGCYGDPYVAGAPWPTPPRPQQPPKNGSGPRIDVAQVAGRIAMLPHRVLAYRGGDGFPAVVPRGTGRA